jgi:hypothetical protein
VPFLIVGPIAENDAPIPVEGHPVVGIRQILRREPEIQRVLAHEVESPSRRDRRRAGGKSIAVQLAHEGDVPHRVGPLAGSKVEVIDAERLLKDRRIGALGNRHQDGIDVAHVVPPHHIRAVGEPPRVLVGSRAEQERRGIDGAGGHHHHTGGIDFVDTVPLHVDAGDRAARCIGTEAGDVRSGQQGDVGMRQGRVDANHLGIRFGVDETGMSIAGRAPDAGALAGISLIQHHADRHVKRLESEADEVIVQLLDPRLVGNRRMPVGRAGRWIGGVLAALAMHLVEMFGLGVVRLQRFVRNGPRRGHTAVVLELAEVLFAEPEERRTVELGVAADEVIGVGVQRLSVPVAPLLLGVVAALDVDRPGAPVLLFPGDVIAALEQQHPLSRRRQPMGQSSAARAGADDDDVVVVAVHRERPPAPVGARVVAGFGVG